VTASVRDHYARLFAEVERVFGPASSESLTGIIGFAAGGPVSICRFGHGPVFVTCELSLSLEQKPSTQGMKFELLSRLQLSESDTQDLLTIIGALSCDAVLGDGHTIDVSAVSPLRDIRRVRLSLFSSCDIDGERYAIYELHNATA
jgi:hypothetical protein